MGEIEVVASPIIEGNVVDRFAGQTAVVGQEQVRDLNAQDAASALRRTPGVNISRYNPIGSFGGADGGAIFIRGLGSSRPGGEFQTFYDGAPRFNPLFNHPLMDILSIDPAQSIQVHKGAQPWNFAQGFAALDFTTKRRAEEGFESRVNLAYGSFATAIESVEHGGKKGDFDYYVGQSFRDSKGHRSNSDGQLQDYFARLGYQLAPNWEVSGFFDRTDGLAKDPGQEGLPLTRQGTFDTEDVFGLVTLSNRYENAEGFLKLHWNHGDVDWTDQVALAGPPTPMQQAATQDLFYDWDLYGLKAREALHLWQGGEVAVGLDVDAQKADSTAVTVAGARIGFDSPTFTILSPHLAVSHEFGERQGWWVAPSAGIRYLNHSEFDGEFAPHAGIVGGYQDTRLHFGYSRGVSYPGLNVVIFSEAINPATAAAPNGAWKNLDPETVNHVEVGLAHDFGTLATAELTLFRDDGQDRYVDVDARGPFFSFRNIEEFTTQGVETTVTVTPLENLSVFSGITYLDTDPADLPFAPKWTFSAGLNALFAQRVRLSVDNQWVSEFFGGGQNRFPDSTPAGTNTVKLGSYYLLNARVGYLVNVEKSLLKEFEIYLAGENLTDAPYQFRQGYPMPGASAMGGVSVRF